MNKEKLTGFLSNLAYSFTLSFRASPKYFIGKCLLLIVNAVFPFLTALAWRNLLNDLTVHNSITSYVIMLVIVYVGLNIIEHFKGMLDSRIEMCYYDAIETYRDGIMISKLSHVDLAFFDSASLQDKLSVAMSGYGVLSEIIWWAFNLLSCVISLVTSFVIVARYNLIIALLTPLFAIPGYLYRKVQIRRSAKVNESLARDSRFRDYYYSLFFNPRVVMEMKLNRFGDYIYNKYLTARKKITRVNRKEGLRNEIFSILMQIINLSSDLLVIIPSVFDVIRKKIGIGDLQYNLSMVGTLRSQVSDLVSLIANYTEYDYLIRKMHEFNDLAVIEEQSGTKIPSENPKIEFDHVTFRYPNSDTPILKDCSFTIEPSQKIGLIGLNGSGKSTIVKLLFRFYDPDSGRILVDSTDMREYDVYALRKRFSVLFQEYVAYDLPLREAIALSDFDEVNNDKKLLDACRRSGFDAVIRDWDEGFDTYLGRTLVDDGKSLSGGQWQLLGLTRAYFRDAPIIVLDEPSASLDPIAEHRIFNQIYALSKGKSSVTISHRLSNTMKADKILVLQDGAVHEQGSHAELMELGGLYAHLFTIQAKRYE